MKWLLFWVAGAYAGEDDGALDLSTLGEDVFNPYLTERHAFLILLPILGILLVAWHLVRVKRKRTIKEWGEFPHAKTTIDSGTASSRGESSGG